MRFYQKVYTKMHTKDAHLLSHEVHHIQIQFKLLRIMVRLKFILRGGVLVLRISEAKTRFYKRVEYLLKGNPNLKHFNQDKQKFSAYAVSYNENNRALEEFYQIYWKLIQDHPELNAKQVANFYQARVPEHNVGIQVNGWSVGEYSNSVEKYLETVILREKAKHGCNYEVYQKLLSRCRKDIPAFPALAFTTLDYNRMVGIAYIFARRKGYRGITKTFRALLGRASRDQEVNFSIKQIGDFLFNDYDPDRNVVKQRHPEVLSQEQLRIFLNMSVRDITPQYKNRKQVELYYDFCVFMFHTFFSPCDVIKLKVRDITKRNTVVTKRKKTHRQVEVPITPVMRSIIDKYKGKSKDGYVFPIMNDEEEEKHKTKDYVFKKFRSNLNIWLKHIGKQLETDYELHTYVFRHTAITVALNNGLPISYVANAAGTSVDMIQAHYYNGECEQNREMLTNVFMSAGV